MDTVDTVKKKVLLYFIAICIMSVLIKKKIYK